MESFNSYKQNKEKFISSLGKYSHSRTETEPAAGKYGRTEQPPMPKEDTSRLFTEINNIWDEKEEKVPQFQRSRKVKCQLDELTDILNETIEMQENMESRPKEFSRPKSTLIKNTTKTEESLVQDKPPMRAILSPRGARAPGRICKNNMRELAGVI